MFWRYISILIWGFKLFVLLMWWFKFNFIVSFTGALVNCFSCSIMSKLGIHVQFDAGHSPGPMEDGEPQAHQRVLGGWSECRSLQASMGFSIYLVIQNGHRCQTMLVVWSTSRVRVKHRPIDWQSFLCGKSLWSCKSWLNNHKLFSWEFIGWVCTSIQLHRLYWSNVHPNQSATRWGMVNLWKKWKKQRGSPWNAYCLAWNAYCLAWFPRGPTVVPRHGSQSTQKWILGKFVRHCCVDALWMQIFSHGRQTGL